MKKNIAVTIQYDGTRYKGWQKQGNTSDTIQGKLEALLSRMAGEEIEIHGSGRTDAGVHAAAQQANFHIDTDMSADEIMDYMNTYLPEDIGVISAREASPRFHSRLNAIKKTYCYRIHTGRVPDALNARFEWVHPEPLDIEAMKEASEYLLGTHDFKSFTDLKKSKKSTCRTIESIEFKENGADLAIYFTGDSFLYHMVRILTGTLAEIGEGKRQPDEIPEIISALSRQAAGPLAPAKGLTLMKVYYD
ncbi:MAG: tRNA pseudouridine(38-40) synthase TruA [Clostridiales bacterium]|nr:tRNA pseudouridine(38-40) synthase TruA [Clostridiales bacterium]